MNDALEVISISAAPLVLVVEDNEQARELRGQSLTGAGMVVIPAADREAALTCLRDGPAVDLIVTDIDLGGGDERGGVELARTVLEGYDSAVPIVAYSGRYYDQDLPASDVQLFRLAQTRGQLSRRQMARFDRRCFDLALEHRKARLERSAHAREHRLRDGKTSVSRELTVDPSISEVEETLSALNFSLRLITSDSFAALATTVVVWLRHDDGEVEVQVCGQPYLHWAAPTEDQALQGLVHVMVGFGADLLDTTSPLSSSLQRLRSYLAQVIDPEAILEDTDEDLDG